MAENGDFIDGKETGNTELNPDALFDSFITTSNFLETLEVFSKLCASVKIDTSDYQNVFRLLKERLTSWKCQTLWNKLDKRAELLTYKTKDKKKPCAKNNVLIIGCGPCGLRFAIEAALLGAKVVVVEKRNSFSRNNVLHLWPFLIVDLKNLGAKKFFGRFCAGTLDHIKNAAMIFEMKGHRLLTCLAGDSLMEPFWPTGSGCARGFLSVFDAAWMMRGWGLGQRPIDLLMEREGVYKLLAQTTSDNVSKNYDDYTIDPKSHYPPVSVRKAAKDSVKHLYKVVQNSLEESLIEEIQPDNMATDQPVNLKNKASPDLLLSWCQKYTKGYKNVDIKNMSSSWKNGLGFCALIHKFRPDLIDFARLNEDDVEKNNELAFSVAENELGIPPQISASEMANNSRTDMLTIVTYLAQYYEAFKDEKPVTSRNSVSNDEVTSPENKHRSPLSKLSVISRISMKNKKEKRKHREEVPAEKTSKKYRVSGQSKEKQPGNVVSQASYKKINDTDSCGGKIQTSDNANGKSSSRISALAEQVFGVKPDQSQQANTTATTPIRHARGSLGDSEHCHFCNERIFVFEKLSAEGFFFHRKCFKCEHCEVTLRLGNYGYVHPEDGQPGRFYCKAHYRKVFYETPGKSPQAKEEKDEIPAVHPARRSHSIGNIDMSMRPKIEKPIDFETADVRSPPRKVLKVPKNLREQINGRSPPRTSTPASEHNVSLSPYEIISLSSVEKSSEEKSEVEEVKKESEKPGKDSGTPVSRGSASRKAIHHKYSKLEAKPLRRSSVSAIRKSDKGTRRLFVHKQKPEEKKEQKKETEVIPPPKPPRAHQVQKTRGVEDIPVVEESGKGKRRRNSKRAMYPESMAFPDSFLITKAVDISLDDDVSPAGNQGNTTNDLRVCLGEATPKRISREPSSGKRRDMDPKKHWSEYYRAAMTSDDSVDEDTRPKSDPEPLEQVEIPPEVSPETPQVPLPTLHEDRELSPTSPKKHKWPHIFGGHHKKEKKSKEEKKRLKEEQKKERKEKKKRRKEKKSKDKTDSGSPEIGLSESGDETKTPEQSDVGSPDSYYESSEEEDLPEAIRLARAREKRFQLAQEERDLKRQKKNHEFHIKLEMRERQRKRLRIAQSIQRELGECEVRQVELETRAIDVEKKMAQLESGNPIEEQKLVLQWFDLVNRKNTLVRYESELVIRSNSIELEDQQQRLEQQIRELMMKDVSMEDDQIKIDQLTRELVDIVEQRNTLVELLDHDRKREQEEDEQFEMMMASKGFVLPS